MEFYDVVNTQRAMRRLKPDPVPDAQSRRIVEDLTGWRYEELWGRQRKGDARQPDAAATL